MAIKRYGASKDATIVNAFKANLTTRGTGSNTGLSDIVEIFSIYGRESSGSQELSRFLMEFPIATVSSDRTSGILPASGSVSFYLRVFNAVHSKTVPRSFTLVASAVSQSWQEGIGLDLENYKDETKGNEGVNWMSASNTSAWTNVGGDYLTGSGYLYSQDFSTGLEDIEIDITQLVEYWIDGTQTNYGIGVRLSSSYEAYHSSSTGQSSGSIIHNPDGATTSYFTKRFFASGSQYFFKRPVLEARWDDSVKDDRGNFYYSSSLAPAADNLNTVYLYNYIRGSLVNIPAVGTGSILLSLYSGSANNSAPSGSKLLLYNGGNNVTGGWVSTGIYSASVAITAAATPLTRLFDVWHSGSTEYATGSITPEIISAAQTVSKPTYYLNITNLKNSYRSDEIVRFNLYIRNKYWNPTIYTVAEISPDSTTISSASYSVYRTIDAFNAISYGTGSDLHTMMSHDVSGNYFDFDMRNLEPGYEYAFKFAFYDNGLNSWVEQSKAFKFRVEDYEY